MIQPLAYVHSDAKIAKNVVIEPFTTISKNVEIGELGVSKRPVFDSDLSLIAELRRRRLRK